MAEAKAFRQEFSNLRLMMTRMSNRLSQRTGFDPDKGADAEVRRACVRVCVRVCVRGCVCGGSVWWECVC
jgi:hypothetical protein